MLQGIAACRATTPDPATAAANCTLLAIGMPMLQAHLPPDAAERVSQRLTIWACQVDPLTTTLQHGVAVGTSAWPDNADLVANVDASSLIPCFTGARFFSLFRGAPFIDGGFCSDFAQMCASSPSSCLKLSTTFLGPDLNGGSVPTPATCPAVTPANNLPFPAAEYYVPADWSSWTLPQGSCANSTAVASVKAGAIPYVRQGVTAKPDIHPAFYAPLPSSFPSACAWLAASAGVMPGGLEWYKAVYEHGYASGAGWADAHGYCA